jgi:transmembrane sensor
VDHQHYRDYSVRDFITDPSFIDWVKNPGSGYQIFWETWLIQHPDRQKEVEEARQFILNINFDRHQLSTEEVALDHQRLKEAITLATTAKPLPVQHSRFRIYYRGAAVFIGVLTLAFAYHNVMQAPEMVAYTTAYGETKTILLPDSSVVTLNANSSIRYPARWHERKVWLEGEAFFEVKELTLQDNANIIDKTSKQEQSQPVKVKFRVQTEDVMVEVLGTEFNVHQRRGKTAVVLNSGKVKLTANQHTNTDIEMSPGDYAAFSKQKRTFERKQVQAEDYSAWRQNQLIFRNASLAEVATLLKDNYDLQTEFKDPEAENFRYTGTTPANNLDELFTKLSLLFPIEITKEGKQVIIE